MKTERRKKTISSPCQACGQPASDRKPFCIDHLDKLPQPVAVQVKIRERDDELRRIARRGWKAVDVDGLCAREVVALLTQGAQTMRRLKVMLELGDDVTEALVTALAEAGVVQRIKLTVKGATEPAVALTPGHNLAEAG